MNKPNVIIIGDDYVDPEDTNFEGSLSFSIKAAYIEKRKLWKSKDITAEFLGDFWKTILDVEDVRPTIHFICAELLENAVYHSIKSDYLIMIQLCFKTDELLIYVRNAMETKKIDEFKMLISSVLEAENLQKLFIQRMKAAKKSGSKKSRVGLITILKDRGAKLSWKFEQDADNTNVTTLAKLSLKGKNE